LLALRTLKRFCFGSALLILTPIENSIPKWFAVYFLAVITCPTDVSVYNLITRGIRALKRGSSGQPVEQCQTGKKRRVEEKGDWPI
jgi:hypothetical protein